MEPETDEAILQRVAARDQAAFAELYDRFSGGLFALARRILNDEQEARDAVSRGLADGLVVSGAATGEPTPIADVKRVRGAVPGAPLLVGSGATAETAADLLSVADGLIVGTSVKRDGVLGNPVDPRRVRRLVEAARGARS